MYVRSSHSALFVSVDIACFSDSSSTDSMLIMSIPRLLSSSIQWGLWWIRRPWTRRSSTCSPATTTWSSCCCRWWSYCCCCSRCSCSCYSWYHFRLWSCSWRVFHVHLARIFHVYVGNNKSMKMNTLIQYCWKTYCQCVFHQCHKTTITSCSCCCTILNN